MEISKRDYFAAHALTGLLARAETQISSPDQLEKTVQIAFVHADEMLKLSKTLLDPVEIDPDKTAAENEAALRNRKSM